MPRRASVWVCLRHALLLRLQRSPYRHSFCSSCFARGVVFLPDQIEVKDGPQQRGQTKDPRPDRRGAEARTIIFPYSMLPQQTRQLGHVGSDVPGQFSFRGVAPLAAYPPLGDPESVCPDSAQRLRRRGPWQAQF